MVYAAGVKMSDAVEWALHTCTTLALLPQDAALPARALAEYLGVSESYLLKNLKRLTAANLLKSLSGPKGGYQLQRSPDHITLLDVIHAIEGAGPIFPCANIRKNVPFPCPPDAFRSACVIKIAMLQAQQAYEETLRQQTIAQLAVQLAQSLPQALLEAGELWFRENVRHSQR